MYFIFNQNGGCVMNKQKTGMRVIAIILAIITAAGLILPVFMR